MKYNFCFCCVINMHTKHDENSKDSMNFNIVLIENHHKSQTCGIVVLVFVLFCFFVTRCVYLHHSVVDSYFLEFSLESNWFSSFCLVCHGTDIYTCLATIYLILYRHFYVRMQYYLVSGDSCITYGIRARMVRTQETLCISCSLFGYSDALRCYSVYKTHSSPNYINPPC